MAFANTEPDHMTLDGHNPHNATYVHNNSITRGRSTLVKQRTVRSNDDLYIDECYGFKGDEMISQRFVDTYNKPAQQILNKFKDKPEYDLNVQVYIENDLLNCIVLEKPTTPFNLHSMVARGDKIILNDDSKFIWEVIGIKTSADGEGNIVYGIENSDMGAQVLLKVPKRWSREGITYMKDL